MANHTTISFLNPIKWYKNTLIPGEHFDDDWAYNQIRPWQKKVWYLQKWKYGDTTPLHVISTVQPDKLKVFNAQGVLVSDFEWVLKAASGTSWGNIYEVDLQLDTGIPGALPKGVHWLYFKVTNGGSYNVEFISEPIDLQVNHPNTGIFEYKHSENKDYSYFKTTGLVYRVRVEAMLFDFLPKSESADYIDQNHNAQMLYGNAWRQWKLLTANTPGNPDYLADLLNRIFLCDSVRFRGKLITKVTGAEWEPQRNKEYPLAGWSIDVTETITLSALQHNDVDPVIPGFINGYGINEDLTGQTNGSTFHILDKQNT